MTALADLGLVEAAEKVTRREVTSTALLDACLARLDQVNKTINATIWVDRDRARADAAAADAALAAGKSLGLLHGIPLAHKDMYYQAGRPCTCGSAIRRDFVPAITCTVVERLLAAGAYSFAGLNMAEFAQNPTGHNRAFGDCHNPWNAPYVTGGSSSGSGAAVASGVTYASLGSDTGGSIRLPASACGVTGIKPTQTRVSRYGVMPLSFSADNVGPLARSARDCARILSIIAGADSRDPTSAREPVPDYEAALTGDLRGVRVGVPTNAFTNIAEPPVLAALEAALKVLDGRGATIVRLELPLMKAISSYVAVISRAEAAAMAGVPFVDLNTIISNRYDAMGEEKMKPFFPNEHTHTNPDGARLNALCVIEGLRGSRPRRSTTSRGPAQARAWSRGHRLAGAPPGVYSRPSRASSTCEA